MTINYKAAQRTVCIRTETAGHFRTHHASWQRWAIVGGGGLGFCWLKLLAMVSTVTGNVVVVVLVVLHSWPRL